MTYAIPILNYNPPSIIEQVLEYVRTHPNCTNAQIRKSLGIAISTTSGCLKRLREAGEVRRIGNCHRYATWIVGTDPDAVLSDYQAGALIQRTVSTWEPVKAGDPMIDLFFGRAA